VADRFQRLKVTLPLGVEVSTELRSPEWMDELQGAFTLESILDRMPGGLRAMGSRTTRTRSTAPIELSLVVPLEQRGELAARLRAAAEEIERA